MFVGCADVLDDGVCLTNGDSTKLTLWVDLADYAQVQATVDGIAAPLERKGVAGGIQLKVDVAAAASSLTIEGVRPAWNGEWSLALQHESRESFQFDVDAPDPEERLADLPERDRLDALHSLTEASFARGDHAGGAARAGELATLASELGRHRRAARAHDAAVHAYLEVLHDYDAALPHVEALRRAPPAVAAAKLWDALGRGLVARFEANPTAAIEAFSEAVDRAESLGMLRYQLVAYEGLSAAYGELGRASETVGLIARMREYGRDQGLPCLERYAMLNSAGWGALLLAQRGLPPPEPDVFLEALSLVGEAGECPRRSMAANVRVNLGLLSLAVGEPDMALAWLEAIEEVPPSYAPWVELISAKAGLELGHEERLRIPMELPLSSLPASMRYNLLVSDADALARWGMREAAADRYLKAEFVLDEEVAAISHGGGRELFLSGRQQSIRGLVLALIQGGEVAEALCRARHARGRALRLLDRSARLRTSTPEARRLWRTSLNRVSQLQKEVDKEVAADMGFSESEVRHRVADRKAKQERIDRRLEAAYQALGVTSARRDCDSKTSEYEGETTIVVLPVDDRWAVFVAYGADVRVNLLTPPAPDTDMRWWLSQAFAGAEALISNAEKLRLLPMGKSWRLEWHALPWGSGVLLDVAAIEYSLDLGSAFEREAATGPALVVADSVGDLPLALGEARSVVAALEARSASVELISGQAISRDLFVRKVADASLLHYAGHGEHGGEAGWEARLRVGNGAGIGVADVLALPSVPTGVVLSGCETGRMTDATLAGGMSLARAFVLSGSQWVIATDREVPDDLAAAIGVALHEAEPTLARSPPEALRAVQQELAPDHPDWAAFRVVTR